MITNYYTHASRAFRDESQGMAREERGSVESGSRGQRGDGGDEGRCAS